MSACKEVRIPETAVFDLYDSSSNGFSVPLLGNSTWLSSGKDVFICFLYNHWEREDIDWINYCTQTPEIYPAASLALDCLATAFYGKRHRQASIIIQASNKYGQALITLRKALQQQTTSCTFDILAASTALSRYETVICTSYRGWIQHAGGITRLIEISGPDAFHCYPNRAILNANRYRIIHQAYCHRVRTSLERREWTALKSHATDEKAHLSKLEDFYARLARLSEDVSLFLASHDVRKDHVQQTYKEAISLLQHLESWAISWRKVFDFGAHERFDISRKSNYNDEYGPVFDSYLEYPCLRAAIGLNVCRGLHLTTLEWKHKLDNPSWWAGEDHERAYQILDGRKLGLNICRSLHTHLSTEEGKEVHGMFAFLFAIRIAYKMFHRHSREAQWISRMLAKVADRSGFELAHNLLSMYSPNWQVLDETRNREKESSALALAE